MNWLRKLTRAVTVVGVILAGVIAGLYIQACSRTARKSPAPSRPAQPGALAVQPTRPASQPTTTRTDRHEVEHGEPFPFNHVE